MADKISEEQIKLFNEFIRETWKNEELRKKLKNDPKKTLEERGIKVPGNISIEVVENTATKKYFILADPTDEGAFSEKDLRGIVAGGGCY